MATLRGFSEEDAQFIILAVDEACTNIIRHAYKGRQDGEITITCSDRPEGIEFLLADSGEGADSSKWHPRPLEEVRPGGLGLHLIQKVMDGVHYSKGERGNELVLTKHLRPRGDGT